MASFVNRLRNNIIFRILAKMDNFLTREEKAEGVRVFLGLVGTALLEIFALGTLFVISIVALQPDRIHQSRALAFIYDLTGFATVERFQFFMIMVVFVVFVVKNGVQLYLTWWQTHYTYDVATNIAERQFRKAYSRGLEYLKGTNSALIINEIMNAPSIFAAGTLLPLMYFFTELILLLLIVGGILIVNPLLFFAIAIAVVPILLIIYTRTKRRLYQMGLERASLFAKAIDKVNQSVFGYQDVMLANKDHAFLSDYIGRQRYLNRNLTIAYVIGFLPQRAFEVVSMLGMVIIFVFAKYFASEGTSIMEFLVMFVISSFRILPSLNRTINAVMTMQTNEPNLDFLVLNEQLPEFKAAEIPRMQFRDKVEVKDLSFTYAGKTESVVRGLNFTLRKGEKLGVVGESGAGKTTLIQLLLRFLKEQEGGIWVDGVKLEEDHVRAWRNLIGYVQQDVFILDTTLKENIAFGEAPDAVDEKKLMYAIEQASLGPFVRSLPDGVNSMIGERGSRISGGQRQRIGIARALYKNAEILIFDEATSSLDSRTEQEITEAVEAVSRSERTVIIIAHRHSTLRVCDRIIELKSGSVAGELTWQQLMAR